jgi:ATP-dependent Clp protease protease subunit
MYRTVVDDNPGNFVVLDILSKLVQERIIFIDGPIDDIMANNVIGQMLYLDSQSNQPIKIYINSVGGDIVQGLAIYDVAKSMKSPIHTMGIGMVASMGAILVLMGSTRKALKHARFLLHQASGGFIGTYKELSIGVKEVEYLQNCIFDIIKEKTTLKNPEKDLLFDQWLSSEEALNINLITEII